MGNADVVLDTSGLICPFPIIETKKMMSSLHKGQILKIICTDPSSVIDFESFVAVSGHTMLKKIKNKENIIFFIQKE